VVLILDDPSVPQYDDLVELIEPVAVVGDEQQRAGIALQPVLEP